MFAIGEPSECWPWRGPINPVTGYGWICRREQMRRFHEKAR
jgi:hypothetical protein